MLKSLSVLILSLFAAAAVQAGNPDCAAKAAEKKLAGAAKNSFMKKCEKDAAGGGEAKGACETRATEKKLAGAAKASFMKKCEQDAAAPAK